MAMYQSAANKRYLRRFVPTMVAYVVVLFASIWAINSYKPEGALLVLLSLLPSLPILATMAIMGIYLSEEPDEYLRRQMATAMLGGSAVVLSVATIVGFLQMGKVIDEVDAIWAFPIWCGAWGLIQCALALRNRLAERGE